MHRGLVFAALTAAALSLLPSGSASATPICVKIGTVGTLAPPVSVGPVCVPYGFPTTCRPIDIGFQPTFGISGYVCLPS